MGMKEKQIKSKSRVNKYGEVFTANKEVNNMLNLIDRKGFVNETVLEPACGTGNFLVEALERKLKAIDEQRHPTRLSYVRDLVTVLATLYGVDIQADNVLETRNRLAIMVNEAYRSKYHEDNKSLSITNSTMNYAYMKIALRKVYKDGAIPFSGLKEHGLGQVSTIARVFPGTVEYIEKASANKGGDN